MVTCPSKTTPTLMLAAALPADDSSVPLFSPDSQYIIATRFPFNLKTNDPAGGPNIDVGFCPFFLQKLNARKKN